jgi:Leucine-rich repeat (LRR) protein
MEIADFSYEGLEELPELDRNLNSLDCSHNKITSTWGLSHCLAVSSLDFSNNLVRQVQGWSLLSNLTVVNLSCNHLNSIQGLSQCYKIATLILSHNHLKHLTGLETLKHLQYLNVSDNQISDKTVVRTLSLNNKLEVLYLEGNPLKNYRQLCYSVILSLVMLDGAPTPGMTRRGSVKDSYRLRKASSTKATLKILNKT